MDNADVLGVKFATIQKQNEKPLLTNAKKLTVKFYF